MNEKFSIGLPDFMTSIEAIKNKKSTEVEQVVTDSNGNTYKIKTKIDELDSKILEASKNGSGSMTKQELQNYLTENKIDTSKWAKDFPKNSNVAPSVESSVAYHYQRHGDEVGATSIEDYMNKAEAFSTKTDTMKRSNATLADGGPGLKYVDTKKKQFIIRDFFGKIISYGGTETKK